MDIGECMTYPSSSVATLVFHHGVLDQVVRGGTGHSGQLKSLAQTPDGWVVNHGPAV